MSSLSSIELAALIDERIDTTKKVLARWDGHADYRLRLEADLMGLCLLKIITIARELPDV